MDRSSRDESLSPQAAKATGPSRPIKKAKGLIQSRQSRTWKPGQAIVFASGPSTGTNDHPVAAEDHGFAPRSLNGRQVQEERRHESDNYPNGLDNITVSSNAGQCWPESYKARLDHLRLTDSLRRAPQSAPAPPIALQQSVDSIADKLRQRSQRANLGTPFQRPGTTSEGIVNTEFVVSEKLAEFGFSQFTFRSQPDQADLSVTSEISHFLTYCERSVGFAHKPTGFENSNPLTMAIEREPPREQPQPSNPDPPRGRPTEEPVFGEASPLRTNLPFIVPKKNTSRPEHHRPDQLSDRSDRPSLSQHRDESQQQPLQAPTQRNVEPLRPQYPSSQNVHAGKSFVHDSRYAPPPDGDVVEIQRPKAVPAWAHVPPAGNRAPSYPSYGGGRDGDVVEIPRPANSSLFQPKPVSSRPTYSSFWGDSVVTKPVVDLTGSNQHKGPDNGLYGSNFGSSDPLDFMDSAKANESIKALLEAAFDEEDNDQPKTRLRTKKKEAAAQGLVDRFAQVNVNDSASGEAKVKGETESYQGEGEEDDDEEEDGTVEGLAVKLLPHQVDGVAWMRDRETGKRKNGTLPKGGILADDMGLGKTLQSIALLLINPRPMKSDTSEWKKHKLPDGLEKNTLVVAPLALIKQWEKELESRVLPSHRLKVYIHHGPQRTKRFDDLKKYDVVITTYQVLVSEHGNSSDHEDGIKTGCFGLHWYRVILDEAHSIKNRNAKATQACYALRAQYRWCLTGTPMQNNLDELQSLIKFLRIKPYTELGVWREQITRPMANGRGKLAIKRLQYFLKAFMKRRTKDILKEKGALVPGGKTAISGGDSETSNGFRITERKIEKISAEFSTSEREFYRRLEQRTDQSLDRMMDDNKVSYASALVLLLRLRQVCNHPELIAGKLAKDKDALTTGDEKQAKSPKKTKATESQDVDDVAAMFGGLSVETRQCEACLTDLSKAEMSTGAIRCEGCSEDLKSYKREKKHRKSRKVRHAEKDRSAKEQQQRPKRARGPRVIDSEDEDEPDGEWLVPEGERDPVKLGKAGGSHDEDAEGSGEEIGLEDTDTESEAETKTSAASKVHNEKVIALDDSEDGTSSSSSSEDEVEDEFYSASEDETKLSSLVISTKIRHLLEILHRESGKHKFIVFSQFTSMLDLIEPFLKRDGLIFTRYDGGMRNELREASLDRLRSHAKTRILLCSLKCGSLGLNLTAASRVVILEPFWNPFIEEQAIDRVHRLNQTVNVVVYKITVKDTVEERILELQEKKRELANAAIEGKAVGKLSMKDIMHLFRRDAENGPQDHGYAKSPESSRPWAAAAPGPSESSSSSYGKASQLSLAEAARRGAGRIPSSSREDPLYGRRW